MLIKTAARFATLTTTLALAACTPVDGVLDSSQSSTAAVSACSGTYWCSDADGTGENVSFTSRDDGCWFGNGRVALEGASADGGAGRIDVSGLDAGAQYGFWLEGWTSAGAPFRTCAGTADGVTYCQTCAPLAPPSDPVPAAPGAHCVGWASPCGSFVAPGCSVQPGCYMHTHVTWSGNYEYTCAGTPTPCPQATTQDECSRQRGCTWK